MVAAMMMTPSLDGMHLDQHLVQRHLRAGTREWAWFRASFPPFRCWLMYLFVLRSMYTGSLWGNRMGLVR
jgi:hypothetical protein